MIVQKKEPSVLADLDGRADWFLDFRGPTHAGQEFDHWPRGIEFQRPMPEVGGLWLVMMIVVETFTTRNPAENMVVESIQHVSAMVVLIPAPDALVADRIHAGGENPDIEHDMRGSGDESPG